MRRVCGMKDQPIEGGSRAGMQTFYCDKASFIYISLYINPNQSAYRHWTKTVTYNHQLPRGFNHYVAKPVGGQELSSNLGAFNNEIGSNCLASACLNRKRGKCT